MFSIPVKHLYMLSIYVYYASYFIDGSDNIDGIFYTSYIYIYIYICMLPLCKMIISLFIDITWKNHFMNSQIKQKAAIVLLN